MNTSPWIVPAAVLALAMLAGGCVSQQEEPAVDLAAVKADLQAVAQARILLGHQSVGRNVLAGVRSLALETGVQIRIEDIDGVPPDAAPGLFHSAIGRNGDPDGKCEAFASLLDRPSPPQYDLAAMKFCYVDFESAQPAEARRILDSYSRMVQAIRMRRPDMRLMHITLPLRSDPPGWKTAIKRLLNRATDEDADNIVRNAYNDALRKRFAGEPLFDLAQVESTLPDGSQSGFSRNGQFVRTLAGLYTIDGGHLNEQGQRRAAAAFLRSVAAALSKGSPSAE